MNPRRRRIRRRARKARRVMPNKEERRKINIFAVILDRFLSNPVNVATLLAIGPE